MIIGTPATWTQRRPIDEYWALQRPQEDALRDYGHWSSAYWIQSYMSGYFPENQTGYGMLGMPNGDGRSPSS